MSSQGMTRKRPAPGTAPATHPQLSTSSNYVSSNPGSQLSNDQFLQWGQNPSANVVNPASFADPSTYNQAGYTAAQDLVAPNATATNQLTRRQQASNQLVSRNRGYEQAPTIYPDQNANASPGEPGASGAWGESLEELYQRALTAKRESQAKRKQIPPFVQKLSRYD